MIDRNLLLNCTNQESLIKLLSTDEREGGLGWQLDRDVPFQVEPEIAKGIDADGSVTVSRLIPESAGDKRLVLLAEFDKPYVRRDLRALLTSLRRHKKTTARFPTIEGTGDTIFIVVSPEYEDVRFVLFEEREKRLPKIRSFGWRHEFVGRTVLTHNLERLRWNMRASWVNAWDVDGLTEEFYDEFVKVFEAVKAATVHPGGEAMKHAYAQQLLNRILFIAFVERMGWFRLRIALPQQVWGPGMRRIPPGMPMNGSNANRFRFDTDYLHALWHRHKAMKAAGRGYQSLGLDPEKAPVSFHALLRKLFFEGIDAVSGITESHPLYPLLGEVPYLNGGLFSEEHDLDHQMTTVEDDVFGLILDDKTGLFRRFNFTVTESTPLDQEVAVDPEMLGKIFERLINKSERHGTGTYYTPRPIVEFMVNEALKGYLTERGLPAEKAAMLVDDDTVESDALSFKPSEMQDTLDWLFQVRAVDPACGSGAYLLMLLQRLFELVDRLEVVRDKKRNPNQKHLYETKLRLLQRCVYGVDLNEIAVRIARLRLWLSLVVENRGEKPEPLPNFDFLIMCGDSLASPVKPDQHTLGYPHEAIKEYTALKRRYFHPELGVARPTRLEMKKKRDEIAEAFQEDLASNRFRILSDNPFDWEIEFAEVFDTVGTDLAPGFDIVLANPPYVRMELFKQVKPMLRANFARVHNERSDLYCYFYAKAEELLRPGGLLGFISSDKWLTASYGKELRSYLSERASVLSIVDFGDLPVFQGTSAYPVVFVGQKLPSDTSWATYVRVPNLDEPYPDMKGLVNDSAVRLPISCFSGASWRFDDGVRSIEDLGLPTIGEVYPARMHYGIKTGLNEAFYVSSELASSLASGDLANDRIIKSLIRGEDIRRWHVQSSDWYVLYLQHGVNVEGLGLILAHLEQYRKQLENRATKQNWFELQQPQTRSIDAYESRKIVYPQIMKEPRFALDSSSAYPNQKCFSIASDDLFLLGILNSAEVWKFLVSKSPILRGGYIEPRKDVVLSIPIPTVGDQDRAQIEDLVQQIIEASNLEQEQMILGKEAEINSRVEFLYFHADETATYDEWVAKKEAEEGTAIEAVRKLIAAGESSAVEFKQSLEYVDPAGLANVPEAQRGQKVAETQKAVVHSALKTLCALMNSKGGTLLIGVHDNGTIIGIEPDYTLLGKKPNRDGFELKLTDLIKSRFKPLPANLDIQFVVMDGKTVCRIDALAERAPHYLDNKLYIRLGNSTEELTGRDLEDWLAGRRESE